MKTLTSIFSALFLSVLTVTASTGDKAKFYKAMGETLQQYSACKTAEDYFTLSLKFERIANAEPEEWTAKYYTAHSTILGNFMSTAPTEERDAKLQAAQGTIDELREMKSADQSEVEALQGFLYTSTLVVDPANRGQKYSRLSEKAISIALEINPNNPRAKYLALSNAQGSAQWFGKDLSPYCTQGKELYEKWDSFEDSKEALAPSWGKDQVLRIANACE